jgi:hypothetical protein
MLSWGVGLGRLMDWVGLMKCLACGVRALKISRGCSRSPGRRIGVDTWQVLVCELLDERRNVEETTLTAHA